LETVFVSGGCAILHCKTGEQTACECPFADATDTATAITCDCTKGEDKTVTAVNVEAGKNNNTLL